jgi:hypothetical protein
MVRLAKCFVKLKGLTNREVQSALAYDLILMSQVCIRLNSFAFDFPRGTEENKRLATSARVPLPLWKQGWATCCLRNNHTYFFSTSILPLTTNSMEYIFTM